MYTLDTNAIIYYLGDEPDAVEHMETVLQEAEEIYVSTIAVLEALSRPDLSEEDQEDIRLLIASMTVVPVDLELALEAARLRRVYRLKTPDSAIAATALHTGSVLATRNVRDFRRIPTLGIRVI